MNIFYDGPLSSSPKGGVVRYFHQISKGILKENDIFFSRRLTGRYPKEIHLPPFTHFRPHRISFYLEYLWHRLSLNYKIDIVHPTEFQLSPSGNFFKKKGAKIVITVHDLIHEKFGAPGSLFDKKKRLQFYSSADGIIFVSNSTQKDFENFYPEIFNSTQSTVIHHGNNFIIDTHSDKPRTNQFLFVGSRNGYKNFKSAADAFCKIAAHDKSVSFIIAGAPPSSSELSKFANFSSQVSWIEYPSDSDLRVLYSQSVALLYVSKYEGFGMPLLEAMSQGCVPIAGNHSSIVEVLGNAGIMVDTNSHTEITSAMRKCLIDKEHVERITANGFTRVNNFDWVTTAKKTLDFYHSL